MHPCVTRTIHPLTPVAFAFLACMGLNPATGSASALESALAPTRAVQTLPDVEYAGAWLAEGEATPQGGHFVCMAEYDDTLPACVQNADGTWLCLGELGGLVWELTACGAGFGLPVFKALRAVDAAHDAFMAARAAKGAKKANVLNSNGAAGAAVSLAWTAIAALLRDVMCFYLVDAFEAWKDCLLA